MKAFRVSAHRNVGIFTAGCMLALALTVFSPFRATAQDTAVRSVEALAFDPTLDALLKSDGAGVYRSRDGGRTWETLPVKVPPDGQVTSIDVAAGEGGTIYISGPGVGILRSDNGGDAWRSVDTTPLGTNIAALAAHATQADTLYAYVPESGIYRTKDGGVAWKLMDRGPENIDQLIHTNMEGSMETGWLYAATAAGVRFSMDCFCLWRDASGVSGPVADIAADPARPEQLYAASAEGLFTSADGGQEWVKAPTAPDTITALVVTPSDTLVAGTADGHVFQSADRATTWEQMDD